MTSIKSKILRSKYVNKITQAKNELPLQSEKTWITEALMKSADSNQNVSEMCKFDRGKADHKQNTMLSEITSIN